MASLTTFLHDVDTSYRSYIGHSAYRSLPSSTNKDDYVADRLPYYLSIVDATKHLDLEHGSARFSELIQSSYHVHRKSMLTLLERHVEQVDEEDLDTLLRDLGASALGALHPHTHTQAYELLTHLEEEIVPQKSSPVALESIVGYDDIKKQLLEDFEGIRSKNVYEDRGSFALGRKFKVILYGEPGTGKTRLARGIAHEVGLELYPCHADALFDQYVGNSEKNVRRVFNTVLEHGRMLLLLDEIDGLAMEKQSEDRAGSRLLNTMLSMLDGEDKYAHLPVIGTTSRVDLLGSDIRRRFRMLHVPLPTNTERLAILEHYARLANSDYIEPFSVLDKERFIDYTNSYSGDDIRSVLAMAVDRDAYREAIGERNKKTSMHDILEMVELYSLNKGKV